MCQQQQWLGPLEEEQAEHDFLKGLSRPVKSDIFKLKERGLWDSLQATQAAATLSASLLASTSDDATR